MKKYKIGAGIIIRNEAERLYDNLVMLAEFCDVCCIVDTGSDDNPKEQINKFMANRFGPNRMKVIYLDKRRQVSELIDGKWLIADFAKARNYYLTTLRSEQCDYCWSWSIGNQFKTPPTGLFFQNFLRKHSSQFELLYVQVFREKTAVWHPRLIKLKGASKRWLYSDAVHEYIVHDQFDKRCLFTPMSEFHIQHPSGNMPSQEKSQDRNFRILKKIYGTPKSSARNNFYYAWALFDKRMLPEAIEVAGRTIHENDKELSPSLISDLAYLILKASNLYGSDIEKRLETGKAFSLTFKHYSPVLNEYAYMLIEAGKLKEAADVALSAIQPMQPEIFSYPSCYNETPYKILQAIHKKVCEDELRDKKGGQNETT